MDFIEGETLEAYLLQQPQQRLSLAATIAIGLQLCSVLDYLHTRQPPIIFRDLKPANIMSTPSNHLYLIDFGIARHFKPGQIKDTIPFGSPGYAAPEQYGKAQTTQQSDIYSLGVLLHQLLSGVDPSEKPFIIPPLPFSGQPGAAELENLIMNMTQLDAEKRPTSIANVQAELQSIAALTTANQLNVPSPNLANVEESRMQPLAGRGQGQTQRPLPPATPPTTTNHTRRRLLIGGALVGMTVGTVGFMSLCSCPNPFALILLMGGMPHHLADSTPIQQPTYPTPTPTPSPPAVIPQRWHTYGKIAGTVAWSPLGDFIASCSGPSSPGNGTVEIWHVANGLTFSQMSITGVNDIAWSPGNFLAAVDAMQGGGSVRAWNPFTGQSSFTRSVDVDGCWTVAYSPDGTLIAVGSFRGTSILSVPDGKVVFTYRHNDQVRSTTWSGNSNLLAWVGALGREARIWHRDTGAIITYPESGMVASAALSLDGTFLAVGMQDGRINIWDTIHQQRIRTYLGHVNYISRICWSPNGQAIASASGDHTAHVWDATTGKTFTIYQGHTDSVHCISWSPDSTLIVSSSADNTVQIWKALP
jgi:WD40 repeat protein